ncbi:hypothetical protein CEJ87_17990 [Caldifermentibacillus hisashii]|nr:hypothetical protein CEJ87_17990 [Caldifermentibacillus hisashii]
MVPPWCLNLVGEPKFILTPRGAFFNTSLKAFLNPTPSVGFSFIQKIFPAYRGQLLIYYQL